ncbi:MAG: hypothetical protein Q8N09_04575 [Thermodesulfovibrionia bacterium]|nr:hypothetical protein [Thermodesulfovibrionia bacterium]
MKKYLLLITLIVLPLFGAGCIQFNNSSSGTDGGVFKSVDAGVNWKQKTLIPTVSGTPRSFSSANVLALAQDPLDRLALYAGTRENGMLYTYDGGESWDQPKDANVSKGKVNAVAVDPQNKCNIYVALSNKLFKSSDCNRSFSEIYRDDTEITSLVIKNSYPLKIYLGTTKGFVVKSQDAGRTWTPLKNFGGKIVDVVLRPADDTVYVAVGRRSLWRSGDGGQNWTDLSAAFKKMSGSLDMTKLVLSPAAANTLIMASKYGLLRTNDGGDTWEALKLLTPAGKFDIYSLAIDSKTSNQIYYSTASMFYKTQNGGEAWSAKKLPSSRAATALLIDAADSNIVYMGVTKLDK